MSDGLEIHGFCDDRFLRLKQAFAGNFERGWETGSSLAVTVDGEFAVDLWAGYADGSKRTAWDKDTLVCVFSTNKIMISLCVLILVDRGELDPDAPVARYWPEFAQAGKGALPVRYIFSHSAGLPGFDEMIPIEALYDWDRIVNMLARQEPWWEPGTESGYHGGTFLFLLGELVRRISGQRIGEFLRTEVADKIGADFHMGLPEEHHARVAAMTMHGVTAAESEPDSIAARLSANPPPFDHDTINSKAFRIFGGYGNARSVARVGSILAVGGELDGKRFLSRRTIEKVLEEQIYVKDHYFGVPVRYGLGFGLPSREWPLPNPNSLHWGGYGGSYCIMDLDARICFAYAMNRLFSFFGASARNDRISEALFACMEEA